MSDEETARLRELGMVDGPRDCQHEARYRKRNDLCSACIAVQVLSELTRRRLYEISDCWRIRDKALAPQVRNHARLSRGFGSLPARFESTQHVHAVG